MDAAPSFTLALALAAGMVGQAIARQLRVPAIVVLLAMGAALGPDGLGWVRPSVLGEGLLAVVHIAVAVILFEGGLNLEISRLRREQTAIRRLVGVGALVTLVGGAIAAHAFFDTALLPALLFGSLVVVTGPTVIGPLVQELRLRTRVATVLEAEGVLVDPVGAILAVLLLEVAIAPGAGSLAAGAIDLLARLAFGTGAGIAGGFALALALRARRLVPEGLENVFVLAAVLLLFEGCQVLVSESGILAVVVAGVVVGNLRSHVDRDLREFKDQLTVLLIGMLFVLLAADVRLADLHDLGWRGLGVLAALIALVRPLSVWICTAGTELRRAERWFVAALAPRGIVAAAVASVAAQALDNAGVEGGRELRALVFLTIAGTVVQAGATAGLLARWLGVQLPGRESVAILGAQGLGLLLGEALRAAGRPVVFLDANPLNIRSAEERGFAVVFGDALQERTLQRARFEAVGEAVGVTPNQTLNSVFADRARERFDVPRSYIALSKGDQGLARELVERARAQVLFDGRCDVERWDVRSRHGEVEVEGWVFAGAPEVPAGAAPGPTAAPARGEAPRPRAAGGLPDLGDRLVLLAVRRGPRTTPMHADYQLAPGDVVQVAVHAPERDAAHTLLRAHGFEPAPEGASDPSP